MTASTLDRFGNWLLTPLGTGKVFLSYRRADSAAAAQRVHEHLCHRFGKENVFMDICSLLPAEDFRRGLEEALDRSAVVVPLIGGRWLTVTDDTGRRRLDDPDDYVRREIEGGMQRDKAVLPVLLDGTPMPVTADLPASLQTLPVRHALPLRTGDVSWQADVERLCRELQRLGVGRPPLVRVLEWVFLPRTLWSTGYGSVLFPLFAWAVAAAVLGGLIWNAAANAAAAGLLVDEPVKEPHGWGALLWPALTMLPVLAVVVGWEVRYRGRPALGALGRLLPFLAGMTLGSWLFYDFPGGESAGLRPAVESWALPFALREGALALLWTTLLTLPGLVLLAVVELRGDTLLKQVGLSIGLTMLLMAVLLAVFSQPGHASLRGGAAGIILRTMLFFALLHGGTGRVTSAGRPGPAAAPRVSA